MEGTVTKAFQFGLIGAGIDLNPASIKAITRAKGIRFNVNRRRQLLPVQGQDENGQGFRLLITRGIYAPSKETVIESALPRPEAGRMGKENAF